MTMKVSAEEILAISTELPSRAQKAYRYLPTSPRVGGIPWEEICIEVLCCGWLVCGLVRRWWMVDGRGIGRGWSRGLEMGLSLADGHMKIPQLGIKSFNNRGNMSVRVVDGASVSRSEWLWSTCLWLLVLCDYRWRTYDTEQKQMTRLSGADQML